MMGWLSSRFTCDAKAARVRNGLSFAPSNGVAFSCVGLHKPTLEHAHFPVAATSIVARFDPQPTNRAGMNGLGPCATVLTDATAAMLRGASLADVLCDWRDDTTVEIFLSMFTDTAPGAAICVRAGALRPRRPRTSSAGSSRSSTCG